MCFENGNSRLIRRRGVLQDAMSGEICLEDEAFLHNSCDGGSRKRLGFSARAVFLLAAFVLAAVGRGRSS